MKKGEKHWNVFWVQQPKSKLLSRVVLLLHQISERPRSSKVGHLMLSLTECRKQPRNQVRFETLSPRLNDGVPGFQRLPRYVLYCLEATLHNYGRDRLALVT
jgi:hypothetical protein